MEKMISEREEAKEAMKTLIESLPERNINELHGRALRKELNRR